MNGSGASYYIYDNPGRSVVAVLSGSQAVLNSYAYNAFGDIKTLNETTPNDFLYTGERYDDETGLIYLRKRYYDPETGRFLSKDPYPGYVTEPQTINPYPYTSNNPIMRVDPRGEFFNLGAAAAGFVIGFGIGGTSAVISGGDFWKSALVSGVAGAAAGFSFGTSIAINAAAGIGAAVLADYGIQRWRGDPIDTDSLILSGFVGLIGGGFSGFLTKWGTSAVDTAIVGGAASGGATLGLTINQNTTYTLRLNCGN